MATGRRHISLALSPQLRAEFETVRAAYFSRAAEEDVLRTLISLGLETLRAPETGPGAMDGHRSGTGHPEQREDAQKETK